MYELKIQPCFFEEVLNGNKRFEIRNCSDRDFQKGDAVLLKEYEGYINGDYTGRSFRGEITYVTNFMQQPNTVVFGFVPVVEE